MLRMGKIGCIDEKYAKMHLFLSGIVGNRGRVSNPIVEKGISISSVYRIPNRNKDDRAWPPWLMDDKSNHCVKT